MRLRSWHAALLVGLAATALYATVASTTVKAVLAVALAALCAAAVGYRALRPGPGRRGWSVLAASAVLWLLGNAIWFWTIAATGAPPAAFSAADAFFILAYLLLGAGILALFGIREPGRGGAIEAAMIAVAVALVSWLAFVGPAFERGDLASTAGATLAIHALLDVLLFAVVGRALLGTLRGGSFRLLLASVGALLVASTAWNWLSLAGTYAAGGHADLGWLAFSALLAASALHPSAAGPARSRASGEGVDRRSLGVVIVAGATVPALAAAEILLGVEIDTPFAVGSSILLTALVLGRTFMLLRESERFQRQLSEQNAELKELDRLKDDFVASVSHELRTPLTSIRGYLELVREEEAGPLTPEQQEFLGIVDRNAERLLRVVGDLLFAAQLDAGTLPLERKPVDVASLALQAADSARPAAQARGVDLSLELGDVPTSLSGDPSRLAQAVDNLVSNAIKFTPAGGSVSLSAAAVNGHVKLEVADTGPGISPDDQRRLFQKFYRTADASSRAVPGTGLGLAITKAIVEAHGGTIEVDSELGSGTTFRISLPVAA